MSAGTSAPSAPHPDIEAARQERLVASVAHGVALLERLATAVERYAEAAERGVALNARMVVVAETTLAHHEAALAAAAEQREQWERDRALAAAVDEAVPAPSAADQMMEAARSMAQLPGPMGEAARHLFGLDEEGGPAGG